MRATPDDDLEVGPQPRSHTSISELIRNIRALRILVLTPPSPEAEELLMHLQRIGCRFNRMWPPPAQIPGEIDVVFVAVRPIIEDKVEFDWAAEEPPACLIAVVDYENPLVVEQVLRMNAQAVIGLPVRPFGIMTNVLLSVANLKRERRLRKHFNRLYAKLQARNEIERAKSILAASRGISAERAYQLIREQAMNKRSTVEEIAKIIISAEEIFNIDLTEKPDAAKL
ncbi:ANTAR domain-containing protein [Paralimibaculum aggregatum]|uniref:ANTAR domain-containing protein n=1 Tax=Paralimibaculum aggregatum TaxID=3036245 RepID=A0ABQ6LHC5_9RHOB|nr:ANTAR domain-containing protein [Limibaculum sp. NKW23]GMG81519.1 ANTAR domain-containing protein [Limibaculum sp. NKW23]